MSVEVLRHLPEIGGFKLLEDKYPVMPDLEASFSVRLFPEGFSIGKPLEKERAPAPAHESMGMLYPYNRTSESFLRALDGGWIPGDLLEDVPCKYVNGCIACEVLDYCANMPSFDMGQVLSTKSSEDIMPVVYKIVLKPTMESIAKDVSSMVNETWTYKDLMEVESQILKTAWPELQLDPKPTKNQTEKKTLLHSSSEIFKQFQKNKGAMINRRLRLITSAKAMVKAGSLINSKKIAFEMTPESLVEEANRKSSTYNTDASIQFALKPKISGPLSLVPQFPFSPKLNALSTPALPEMVVEKPASLLGKRDARDFEVKLDIKKSKHDSPRVVSMGFENSLETVKPESQEDTTRMRDDNIGFGMDAGQAHLQDPQLLYQKLTNQEINNQAWQLSSLVGDKDNKHDELLQRKRLLMMQQKVEGRVLQQPLTNDTSRLPTVMHSGVSTVASSQPKDQLQVGPLDPMLQAQHLSRRRTNSLPKNSPSISGVASPGSTINSGGVANVTSPSTASMPSVVSVKNEGFMGPGQRNEPLDNFMVLVSVAKRHGLPAKRQKIEITPPSDGKKTAPLFHELECALNTPCDEIKDPKGQRNMADSLVGGVNTRKTHFLQFQRQGPHFRRVRVRLVMCERGRDAMVEAVVQFGDDQDDETLNSVPHHVLPTMANAHAADIFARQFWALLEKEGFELVEDQVQPTLPRGNATTNAASAARPLPAGASTLGNSVGPLPSPRSLINAHVPAMAAVNGMPGMSSLQPSSPGTLAATRMPPPGNSSNRQVSGGYLNVSAPQLSSLDALQHSQQHQPHHHLHRAQQMAMPNQLAQLNHNPAQQLNQQMVANPGQLQQFLQQQQQQRQQAQTSILQRKFMSMGGMGAMANLGGVGIPANGGNQGALGNMVGVNAMNNVVGMSGINNVSAPVGSMSAMNNVGQLQGLVAMGQSTGLGNLIGRPGNLSAAHFSAFSSKAHLAQGRTGLPLGATNPTARDNLTTGLNTSQLHASAGLPMMGQSMSRVGRVGLTPTQRGGPVGSLGSPRGVTSNVTTVATQGIYLNPQQVNSQQQFNLQQLSPMQQTGQQQPLAAQHLQQLKQAQQANIQVQQQVNPPQQLNLQQPKSAQQVLNSQTTLLSQTQQQQQLNPQAQITSGAQQNTLSGLGSQFVGPTSPQLSSQNLGSATSGGPVEPSITNNCSATSLSSS